MKDIKTLLYFAGLGASLIIYAHTTFTTVDVAKDIKDDVKEIRKTNVRIDEKLNMLSVDIGVIKHHISNGK